MNEQRRIFISSVQKQLAQERLAIERCIISDDLLCRHCKPILFEKEPPPSRPSSWPYLDTLRTCEVYVLIIGDKYGELDGSLSAIHREYRLAKELMLPTIVFIKGQSDELKTTEVQALIDEIRKDKITYKRFQTIVELIEKARSALEVMLDAEFKLSKKAITKLPDRNVVLRHFSAEFLNHDPLETSVVDYYSWHESNSDWLTIGNGLLATITFGEIYKIWIDENYFPGYESKLLLFKKEGGRTKRTFVIENEVTKSPTRMRPFCRVLNRHIKLKFDPKFDPKVRRVGALDQVKVKLGINCDMFGTLNGKLAYFFIFEDSQVLMVRTTHKDTVIRVSNLAAAYYEESHSATSFIKKYANMIPPDDAKIVEHDISLILNWHAFE